MSVWGWVYGGMVDGVWWRGGGLLSVGRSGGRGWSAGEERSKA
jgi:hypothetical protein